MIGTIFAALLGVMQSAPPPATVEVFLAGKRCAARVDGQVVSSSQLTQRAQTWAREKRKVRIVSHPEVPYNCIGGALFMLQMADVQDLAFLDHGHEIPITAPPPRGRVTLKPIQ